MINIKTRKAKIVTFSSIAAISFTVLFFLLRGPYLSNSIKRSIIPVLENVTRERILIDKAVINLFPFYVQAKGLKLFDKDGNRLLWVTKTRAYIDLMGLLSNELRIRKITLKEPDLTADKKDLDRIMDNINRSSSAGKKGIYRVSLKNIKLTEGIIKYSNMEQKTGISGTGLYLNMSTRSNSASIDILLKQGTLKLPNNSELPCGFDGKIKIKDQRINISGLNLHSSESELDIKGEILLETGGKVRGGSLSGSAKIYIETLMKGLGLKKEKDGMLSFNGSIDLIKRQNSKWPGFKFNLNAESRFYLETLMKIVGVNENIRGKLAFDGKISGIFPELVGEGKADLEDAVFATLPLDDLSGDIKYEDQRFSLTKFTAHTYNGKFEGKAHILIPSGNYSVSAGVSDVSSPDFFKFIKWEPPFQDGELSGNFQLNHRSGQKIAVTADLKYLNITEAERDLLTRLKSVNTHLELRDGGITFRDTVFSTGKSDLFMNGYIDLEDEELDLDLRLQSRDVTDLTSPHYSKLNTQAEFNGKLKGRTGEPVLSGRIDMDPGSLHGIKFEEASADFTYSAELLSVDRLRISQGIGSYDISGSVRFREAEKLFSFKGPFYSAKAIVGNVELKQFVELIYGIIPVSGSVSGMLSFEGDRDNFKGTGDLVAVNSDVYGQHIDKVTAKGVLHPDYMEFQSVSAFNGDSNLAAGGTISFDKTINFSASSNNIQLNDIALLRDWPVDAAFNMELTGSGTINNPDMKFSLNVNESSFSDIKTGEGKIEGTLKNKKLSAVGDFVDGSVAVQAGASFSERTPWFADLSIARGSYDFLLSGFLNEVPDDLSLILEGEISLEGQGSEYSMISRFGLMKLGLYGYNFRNNKDIIFEQSNDEFLIKSFSLNGKNADLSAAGTLKINKQYNLKIRGNLDITPLRVLTDNISSLKGQSDFSVDINGPWDDPEFVGKVDIKDTTVSIEDFPYKIGPVNGILFLEKDRIVFDSINTSFASGSIVMSGAGYLDRMSLERLFVSSAINGIRIRPMGGVSAVFDGGLFYELLPDRASLTGDIDLKKAKYTKKVEFSSFILGLREIKESPDKYPGFLEKTEINIHVAGSENIVIDNNIARTPVGIDLNVMGTIAKYGLIGRIETDEGNIYFRGNEFEVLKGSSVEFIEANRISPVFHILAETYISSYYIKMVLDGTMDRFDLSLFSDPPLSEVDILSLLTFGQVKGGEQGFAGGLAASEAASLLTGNLQGEVQEEIKNITGFERFEIEPHTTRTGAFSPKVTVGKRLLEDKLFVIYSTSIGTTEENVIKLKYNLNKNVSVEGSRNEIGSAGGDLKYRFEFK